MAININIGQQAFKKEDLTATHNFAIQVVIAFKLLYIQVQLL